MLTLITILAGALLLGILGLTHFTPIGVKGIKAYWPDFQLFDMQFSYQPTEIHHALTNLNCLGREAYKRYLLIDYIFILCFLFLMLRGVERLVKENTALYGVLFILAILRAFFDIVENTGILRLIRTYPKKNQLLSVICSYSTTLKFICLFSWLLVMLVAILYKK